MKILAWPGDLARELNPYTRLLYQNIRKSYPGIEVGEFSSRAFFQPGVRWDVWHLHWPEGLLNIPNTWRMAIELAHFVAFVSLAKIRGVRLIWTIHDLNSHACIRPRLEKLYKRWFISQLDGAITLTPGGRAAACARFPRLASKPIATIPHGHFMDAYPNATSRSAAREKLGLADSARVLLFFGTIRPYKNLPRLIKAFSDMDDSDLRLIIAGAPESDGIRRKIRMATRSDRRILLHPYEIEPTNVQFFMNAADVVVLPFKRIQNSGSVMLALTFLRPVLVPAIGAMPELREFIGGEWIKTYSGNLESAHLREVLADLSSKAMQAEHLNTMLRDRLGWDSIAAATIRFFDAVTKRKGEYRADPRRERGA